MKVGTAAITVSELGKMGDNSAKKVEEECKTFEVIGIADRLMQVCWVSKAKMEFPSIHINFTRDAGRRGQR